jgi:hypothetical protein
LSRVSSDGSASRAITYLPRLVERVQIAKGTCNRLVGEVRLVLLQQPAACLGVVGLCDRVLQIRLFERVERDDDAVDLGQGVVQVSLGVGRGQLDFLRRASVRCSRCEGVCRTSSRLMVADSAERGM